MLRKIVQAALRTPEWRPVLLPLVHLGRLQQTRVASGTVPLRTALIRTAYETRDHALRDELVRIVVAHDSGNTSATAADWRDLIKLGRDTTNPQLRRRVASLLRSAKYSPGFLQWVERQKFRNPDTGNEVGFHSLPTEEQKKIHAQWVSGKKEWAQKFKPEGLSKETTLTPEKFDTLEKGDLLWVSYSPKKLFKVTGRSKTRGGKGVLEAVLVDRDDPSKEGEKRYLHRSTVENDKHEIHLLPKEGGAEPEKSEPEKSEPEKSEPEKSEPEKSEPEKSEPEKSEPTGKYKDRKELRGRSKKKPTDAVEVSESLRALMLPEGMEAEQRKHAEEQLKRANYELLGVVHQNFEKALEKPDGKIMKALKRQGYSPEGVKELHEALGKKLDELKGRRYNKTVLDIANKHDLEGEDADELYSFKHDHPHRGRKLAPQELMRKFLAKASPETKKRMEGMPLNDFMAMYNAIMADEEEGEAAD